MKKNDVFKFELKENDDVFSFETSAIDNYQEEYLDNFTNPTKPRKNLADYRKVNTKFDVKLHRILKTYCAENDLKKNSIFMEALEQFSEKFTKNNVISYNFGEKKQFNFELPNDFFRKIKVLAVKNEIMLADIYEYAIIYYLEEIGVLKTND
ncbi:hypothetical protein AWH56_018590 [Anaerobacillus isosaccharinicus]|uniref:Uncharacterized protein n=1 Tax=Anaerobacillus isosaccharinicus TaxID=1532552 RepID=A0A1S2LIB4_9BACI|nr:hypothetical protein [Anaerobacillus isosaccharinicus]MBA5587087.1 hypothetical protein [Anaerobacillus isosaccharinicus]QOY34717.1 hypothetical protein AWH56_018590 [Anaerobacillus isosaccharinicus]